jgi:hypothetical protein
MSLHKTNWVLTGAAIGEAVIGGGIVVGGGFSSITIQSPIGETKTIQMAGVTVGIGVGTKTNLKIAQDAYLAVSRGAVNYAAIAQTPSVYSSVYSPHQNLSWSDFSGFVNIGSLTATFGGGAAGVAITFYDGYDLLTKAALYPIVGPIGSIIGECYYKPYNAVCFMAGFSLGMPFLGLTSTLYKTI